MRSSDMTRVVGAAGTTVGAFRIQIIMGFLGLLQTPTLHL